MLLLVQQKANILISEEAIEIVRRFDSDIIMILLDFLPDLPIPRDIVRVAAQNWISVKALISLQ